MGWKSEASTPGAGAILLQSAGANVPLSSDRLLETVNLDVFPVGELAGTEGGKPHAFRYEAVIFLNDL